MITYEAVAEPPVQEQARMELAERIAVVEYAQGRVCFTCGEAYVGLTDKACPFCGSTVLDKVRWPGNIGGD